MAFEVEVEIEALQELNEAADWYEQQNKGLGSQFIDVYLSLLEHIQGFPYSHPIYRSSFRQAVMQRFPFVVVYKISEDTITIMAVFHTSRNPIRKDR